MQANLTQDIPPLLNISGWKCAFHVKVNTYNQGTSRLYSRLPLWNWSSCYKHPFFNSHWPGGSKQEAKNQLTQRHQQQAQHFLAAKYYLNKLYKYYKIICCSISHSKSIWTWIHSITCYHQVYNPNICIDYSILHVPLVWTHAHAATTCLFFLSLIFYD